MAFVLLPCDLPTWPTIQRHLSSLKNVTSPDQVTKVLFTLHSLCNVSIESDLSEEVPDDVFAGVERFLTNEADPEFFQRTLPTMVDAALKLKQLKPPQGLMYSLQQQKGDLVLERSLVSSLLAHTFFCTLPRRSLISHPTLSDPCFAPTLATLHRESQRVKIKALLQYFKTLSQQSCPGHLTFSRKVMGSKEFLTLGDWMRSEDMLCPVVIQREGRLEDAPPPALLACFTSPDLARPALTRSNSQQVCAMLSQPELLVTALFVERLEDNEAMQVKGALRTSTVSNLKSKPTMVARKNVGPPDLVHVLMDADDYRLSEVLQYEEINVLRELNKARLAFSQSLPDPPPHQSLSDIVSVSRQYSHGSSSPPTRFRTQVSSESSGESRKEEESLRNSNPSKRQVTSRGSTANWVNDSNILKKREKERAECRQKSKAVKEHPSDITCDERVAGIQSLINPRRKKTVSKEADKAREKQAEAPKVVKDEKLPGKPAEKTKVVKEEKTEKKGQVVKDEKPTAKPEKKGEAVKDEKPTVKLEKKGKVVKDKPTEKPEEKGEAVKDEKPTEKHEKKGKVVKDVKPTENPEGTAEGLARQESAGSASPGEQCGGFVTAPTTLKRRRKKADQPSKGAKAAVPSDDATVPTAPGKGKIRPKEAERVTFAAEEVVKDTVTKSKEGLKDQRANSEDDEETTRLLNRVLRAIQRLEQERPDLLQEAKLEEQQTQMQTTAIRQKGKPPLPGGDLPRPSESDGQRAVGPPARSISLKEAGAKQVERMPSGEKASRHPRLRVGAAQDGRKLSIYYSCTEEAQTEIPSPDEDHYYSASETLDCLEAPRPRRPSKRRGRRNRRKSSFAERLKETLARKLSVDSQRPSVTRAEEAGTHQPRLSRQNSGGFVLDDDLPRAYGQEEEESEYSEEEEEEEEEEDGKAKEGSGSSHYSFSSDYISDLEEVYEQLEAVLEDPQEGELGPRTAVIAKFAHGLLKRALSESYKDISLGLDGSALRGPQSVEPLPPRSLSLSEHSKPASCILNQPSLRTFKGERGRPVVTGNWGCGSLRGDHQLKAMVQWAAASKAGAPKLIYYNYGDHNTVKLDIVCRLLGDRGWRVGDVVTSLLRYCESRLDSWRRRETELTESADSSLPESHRYRSSSLESLTLFDELIGADRPYTVMETEL